MAMGFINNLSRLSHVFYFMNLFLYLSVLELRGRTKLKKSAESYYSLSENIPINRKKKPLD